MNKEVGLDDKIIDLFEHFINDTEAEVKTAVLNQIISNFEAQHFNY